MDDILIPYHYGGYYLIKKDTIPYYVVSEDEEYDKVVYVVERNDKRRAKKYKTLHKLFQHILHEMDTSLDHPIFRVYIEQMPLFEIIVNSATLFTINFYSNLAKLDGQYTYNLSTKEFTVLSTTHTSYLQSLECLLQTLFGSYANQRRTALNGLKKAFTDINPSSGKRAIYENQVAAFYEKTGIHFERGTTSLEDALPMIYTVENGIDLIMQHFQLKRFPNLGSIKLTQSRFSKGELLEKQGHFQINLRTIKFPELQDSEEGREIASVVLATFFHEFGHYLDALFQAATNGRDRQAYMTCVKTLVNDSGMLNLKHYVKKGDTRKWRKESKDYYFSASELFARATSQYLLSVGNYTVHHAAPLPDCVFSNLAPYAAYMGYIQRFLS